MPVFLAGAEHHQEERQPDREAGGEHGLRCLHLQALQLCVQRRGRVQADHER